MWILFGTTEKTKRVAGGASVERRCESCGETTIFYEKETLTTVQVYLLDVFDYGRQRVMACGACGAHYATDEIAPRAAPPRAAGTLAEAERAARRAGELLGRAAETVEARVASFLQGPTATPPVGASAESARSSRLGSRPGPPHDEDLSDDDRDALEARFRELEERDRLRIKS